MKGVSLMLRRLVAPCIAARSISESIILSSAAAAASYSTLFLAEDRFRPLFLSSTAPFTDHGVLPNHHRNFSSSPSSSSSDPSKVVLIESEEHFNDSLRKVKDESLPAIFYFTAAWCAPCRLLSPIISQLGEQYPHVTTYKVDIDKDLGNTLSKLNINSVPTLHFFLDGKKASEVIGADAQRLKETMEALFK